MGIEIYKVEPRRMPRYSRMSYHQKGPRTQLQQELSGFAAGLEGYWDYYRKAEAVYQGLIERYPRAVVQALACGWQSERQATNSKDYGIRQRLAQEAKFYYD